MTKKRVRSTPRHRTFRLTSKKLKQPQRLPHPWKLIKNTFTFLLRNKKLFIGLALINMLVSLIFVQGLGSSFDVVEVKNEINDLVGDQAGQITTAVTLFGYLLGSAGSGASESSGAYQLFVTLVTSLAVIWAIRQVQAGEQPRLRDAFYKGMYPLIPFLLVLIVISLQLIPLLLGNLLYGTVAQNGLAVTPIEQAIWLLLFVALAVLSGYMLTSSLFALYIATLPDMTPIKALRSARDLVLHRRLAVWLRIIAMPVLMLILSALIFVPLLILVPVITQLLFLVMVSLGLIILQIYMYLLYRSLL